jgi:hypothetical protein
LIGSEGGYALNDPEHRHAADGVGQNRFRTSGRRKDELWFSQRHFHEPIDYFFHRDHR